jgi:hypothetical protein
VKLRNANAPHRTKKDRFFCQTDLRRSKARSNRWPDVSPTPSFVDQSALGRNRLSPTRRLKALVTRRHQGRRHPLKGESYFFFFDTLRVFFAVFFTALFAFFFAFLAMLPS